MGRKAASGCCVAAVFFPCALIIIGEVLVPQMITSKLHDALVKDDPAEMAEMCDPNWAQNVSITLTVFNLTNARELQTVTPAPKPHFDAIDVEFTQVGMSFNCSLLDGGEKIKYHDWSKWVPTDPEVYDWEFVQVNPAYIGMVGALAPSEAMLFMGLSHAILGAVEMALGAFGAGVIATGTGVEMMVGASIGEAVTTAKDVGMAQFGVSAVTNLLGALAAGVSPPSLLGFTSVASDARMQAAGVCTPIELGVYVNDLSSGPFASGSTLANLLLARGFEFSSFNMTMAEAKSFFARYSNATGADALGAPNWAAVLGMLAQKYSAALLAGDMATAAGVASQISALFAPTFGTLVVKHLATGMEIAACSSSAGGDLCPLLAAAYVSYLTSYLPEKFFVGCQLLGCADSTCLRDDGTYPLNSGLFTRLTLRQMLHDGNSDRLFAAAPKEAVPPGVTLEYNGLLGQYATMDATLDDLRRGEADLDKFSSVQLSGKSDVTRVREWVEYQGKTLVEKGDPSYPGWGNDGTPGEPFDFSGHRYLNNQAPQTQTNSPIAMAARGYQSSPNFGTHISFLLTVVRWPVTLGCGAASPGKECEFYEVKGIQTQKFTGSEELLKTKKGGMLSDSCRGTVSTTFAETYPGTTSVGPTCDFLQRHDGVINLAVARGGAPVAVTQGFLGQTSSSVRDAVSITRRGDASEVYYDASKDELALYVEPITGAVIAGFERLQTNWYVEQSMVDSVRYANVFSADSDNDDVFVWPFMFIKKEPAITEAGAKDFISLIYGAYDNGWHLDLLGIMLSVVCALLAGICLKYDNGKFVGAGKHAEEEGAQAASKPEGQTEAADPELETAVHETSV